jgi:hypothetical protein
MIDWDKPIETVYGRAAKLLSRGYWRDGETYCVVQVEDDDGNSEIVIVNPTTGYHAWSHKGPFRNVPVKIEAWAVVKHYPERGRFVIIGGDIIQSEAEAREFHMKAIEWAGSGCRLVRVVITEREE